jgi:formiminotetrahydrofolate cyclodeaminase
MESYLDKPLAAYLADAAGKKPTPGGGSVAALVGALATTMSSMAANFTAGKEKYRDVEARIQARLRELDEARREFLSLMHRDMEAYQCVNDAYRMPKESDAERKARDAAIQQALSKSMQVPLRSVRVAVQVLEAADELARIANANLLSDVAVSAVLAQAALVASRINVEINLKSLADQRTVAATRRELDDAESRARELKASCLKAIEDRSA